MADTHVDRERGSHVDRARPFIVVSAVFLLSMFLPWGAPAQAADLVVGTGSTAGVSYRAGKAMGLCDAMIVEVVGPAIDTLMADNPFYAYTDIPAGIYPGGDEAVTSFGVKATVVASAI